MADPITDDLADMFGETLVAKPGSLDRYGAFVASGANLNIPARIVNRVQLVRDPDTGREIVSSARAILGGVYDISPDKYRFDLPSADHPRENLQAIQVMKVPDENGPHHEVIYFP